MCLFSFFFSSPKCVYKQNIIIMKHTHHIILASQRWIHHATNNIIDMNRKEKKTKKTLEIIARIRPQFEEKFRNE